MANLVGQRCVLELVAGHLRHGYGQLTGLRDAGDLVGIEIANEQQQRAGGRALVGTIDLDHGERHRTARRVDDALHGRPVLPVVRFATLMAEEAQQLRGAGYRSRRSSSSNSAEKTRSTWAFRIATMSTSMLARE